MSPIVKTVLLGGTVVEVGSLCPQQSVHKGIIVLEGQKMTISMSALVDTNVQQEVQTLYPAMPDITKMRQYKQPAESVHADSTAMIPMDQLSPTDSTFALRVTIVPVEQGMLRSSSVLQEHLTTELEWNSSQIACLVLVVMPVMSGVL